MDNDIIRRLMLTVLACSLVLNFLLIFSLLLMEGSFKPVTKPDATTILNNSINLEVRELSDTSYLIYATK